MRVVAPADRADQVLELMTRNGSVCNVIRLPGAALKPEGDVVLADVPREDASVILADLRELDIDEDGSIALENVDTEISAAARRAEEAATGLASDAVVWEEVEERTSENVSLSFSFLAFMVIATMIAAVGILSDSPVLIVGAMVVGPEFGAVAGVSVAIVQRRIDLARRSVLALAVGFPLAIAVAYVVLLGLSAVGVAPAQFRAQPHPLTSFISEPDFFSVLIAFLAGAAGVMSLTSAKSGALIGVLISVATIPAAANIGVAAVYRDWAELAGASTQLTVNLLALVAAGVVTLLVQRTAFHLRWRRHIRRGHGREEAGLPSGSS